MIVGVSEPRVEGTCRHHGGIWQTDPRTQSEGTERGERVREGHAVEDTQPPYEIFHVGCKN